MTNCAHCQAKDSQRNSKKFYMQNTDSYQWFHRSGKQRTMKSISHHLHLSLIDSLKSAPDHHFYICHCGELSKIPISFSTIGKIDVNVDRQIVHIPHFLPPNRYESKSRQTICHVAEHRIDLRWSFWDSHFPKKNVFFWGEVDLLHEYTIQHKSSLLLKYK